MNPTRKHDGRRAPVRREAIRDAIRSLGTFTPSTLADALDCTDRTVHNHLRWFIERGIVERVARGVYVYTRPAPDAAAVRELERRRAAQRAAEAAMREHATRRRADTARPAIKRRASRPEVRDLLNAVVAAGGSVRVAKHGYLVDGPAGRASVPGTASDHRSLKNAAAAIRRDAGLTI